MRIFQWINKYIDCIRPNTVQSQYINLIILYLQLIKYLMNIETIEHLNKLLGHY